jgi:hypothetical protein
MGGCLNKRQRLCADLARDLGFRDEQVWRWYTEIASAIWLSSVHKPTQAIAEAWAIHILPAVLDKRGCSEPS